MIYRRFLAELVTGFVITGILGAVFHFVYGWSGENVIVGLFFPVDESTWEHMKLMFFPMLGFSCFVKKRWTNEYPAIGDIFLLGTLFATWMIPCVFYTYKGILGFTIDWLNIASFYVSELLGALFIFHLLKYNYDKKYEGLVIKAFIALQFMAFLWFSYHPGSLGICIIE